jgi:hypothetical protein
MEPKTVDEIYVLAKLRLETIMELTNENINCNLELNACNKKKLELEKELQQMSELNSKISNDIINLLKTKDEDDTFYKSEIEASKNLNIEFQDRIADYQALVETFTESVIELEDENNKLTNTIKRYNKK